MGYTEFLQVGDFLDQRRESARCGRTARGMAGEAAHVQFVDHRALETAGDRAFTGPVECRVAHHGAQAAGSFVGWASAARRWFHRIARSRRARPGVEEILARVEGPPARRGIGGPVHAPRIMNPGQQRLDEYRARSCTCGSPPHRAGSPGTGAAHPQPRKTEARRGSHAGSRPRNSRRSVRRLPPAAEATRCEWCIPPMVNAQACRTRIGRTPQILSQYSRIERSEENFPPRAVLRIDMRVQRS